MFQMFRIAIAVFVLALSPNLLTAQENPVQENPGDVMQAFIQDVQDIWVPLNRQEGASYDSRRDWTIEVVHNRFDVPQMSRRSLGTMWRVLSPEQQAQYSDLFFDLLVETVIDWLDAYDGEVFEILSVREAGQNSEIVTQFEYANGQTLRATWVTRAIDGVYLIRDVRVSGISLTSDFRGRHQNALRKDDIDGLFAFLESAIDRLKAQHQ